MSSSNSNPNQMDVESESSSYHLKYSYTKLNQMTEQNEYNFYGVIYDASFPIQEDSSSFIKDEQEFPLYSCSIKLIDSTINCITNPHDLNENIITLIIKSSEKESMPYIHNIGDIIRIHRGTFTQKNNKKTVYARILKGNSYKSSWCLFSGGSDFFSREMNPYSCSHQHFTFEQQDRQIINTMRDWVRSYFNQEGSLFYSQENQLNNRINAGSDYDALVQVVHKVELSDQIVFFVQDETDGCELHTFKYFNFIEVNDIIRIRSYKVFDKNVILLNSFSNILKIPQNSKYYKVFINKLAEKLKSLGNKDMPLFAITPDKTPVSPLQYGDDSKKHCVCKIVLKPNEIYEKKHTDEINPNSKKFLMDLNIMEIYPKPLYNCVNVLCEKCKNSFSITEVEMKKEKIDCPKCKTLTKGNMHYNATLQCCENYYSNKLLTLYLSTYDGEGDRFFGMTVADSYRDANEFKKLNKIYKALCEPGNFVTVLVEQYPGGVLRIIGRYENFIQN